jgi:hypothetical protein
VLPWNEIVVSGEKFKKFSGTTGRADSMSQFWTTGWFGGRLRDTPPGAGVISLDNVPALLRHRAVSLCAPFFVPLPGRAGYIRCHLRMGGLAQSLTCSWRLLGCSLAVLAASAADAPIHDSWLPPRSTVLVLAGLSGDVESERSYRDQLQGWLEVLASAPTPPERVFILWENPDTLALPPKLTVERVVASRDEFLAVAKRLAGETHPLVVIAWGHGGMQGKTPVLHVRGPRLTPADFKTLADAPRQAETRWLLFFRGSGRFAGEVAREGRQIISSDQDTPFSSDPIGGLLVLQAARANPAISLVSLADELGRRVGAWYDERHLARTEEPVLWLPGTEPRRLVTADNAGALTAVQEGKKTEAATLSPKPATKDGPPVELPDAWKDITRVEPRMFPEDDAVVLRRRVNFTLGSSPAVSSEHEEFVQILAAEGKRFGDFDELYSPPQEEIQFLDCEVLRADGKLLRLSPEDIHESAEPSPGDYRTSRRKFFSLPGVAPGAMMRVHYRSEWKSYPLPHVSVTIPLASEMPIIDLAVQVTVAKDSAFHFAFEHASGADPEIKQTTHGNTYAWQFKNVPAVLAEALAPPHHQPALLISTFPDWAAFAEWYDRISKLTDEVTPDLAAKAKELTRDTATDRDKVLALYNYVTGLRYVAVPLGVNSFRPHAAANVFKNQFGDCKDKANLFNTLLHSLGFEAHLVLVPRFAQAQEAAPGLTFNHAISRVKLGDDVLWLDTTDDVCRFGMLPPGDAGRNVLVIDGQSAKLTSLPRSLAKEHRLELRARVKCTSETAPSALSIEAKATGFADYDLRATARAAKEGKQNIPLLATKFRTTTGVFALTNQSASPVSKLDEDFTWRAEGECVGLLSAAGGQWRLRAPFWVPKEWDLALHRRQSPLFLNSGYALTLDEQIDFAMLAGAASATVPPPRDDAVGPLYWRLNWSKTASGLRATLHVELERGELSDTQTRRFQQGWRELLTVLAKEATFSADP